MNGWFEVFRTGEHTDSAGKTRVWSEADLDKIAGSYNPAVNEAPIVIGHPATNAPAYGWIAKLKRVGDKLLALPKNVVPEFADAVKRGLFKKRSISLYPDGTLRHIGFLGAAIPAVKGLRDIAFEESPEITEYELSDEDFATSEREELLLRFSESEERRKRAEQKLYELEAKLRLTEFSSYLNQKVAAGILTPAQSGRLYALTESLDASKFSQHSGDVIPIMKEFIDSLQPQYTIDEIAVKQAGTHTNHRSPAQIIADEISRSNAVLRNLQK